MVLGYDVITASIFSDWQPFAEAFFEDNFTPHG